MPDECKLEARFFVNLVYQQCATQRELKDQAAYLECCTCSPPMTCTFLATYQLRRRRELQGARRVPILEKGMDSYGAFIEKDLSQYLYLSVPESSISIEEFINLNNVASFFETL